MRGKKRILCALLILLLCISLLPARAGADAVTDTLRVAVGYWGMDLGDYVTVGTYHWSQLESDLPIYEEAYSYYQDGRGTDYTAIVDSARGFLVEDLLDYAGIYYGDVYNLQFYVMDHHGIQASFDRDSLFGERYYFDDLPFHLERIYDESGDLVDYGYDEVWDNAWSVRPMLALEDNWASFTQEFEHIGPNFESMSAATRFRLLFGQYSPTESLTSASAKYVSCVYVTLYGAPAIGDMPELDSSLGAHEVTARVTVDNVDMRDALSEYMRLDSTDENVLRITDITVTPVEGYSDLADVTISYEIVGPGSASITAGFGGSTETISVSSQVEVADPSPSPSTSPGSGGGFMGGGDRPGTGNRPGLKPDPSPAPDTSPVPDPEASLSPSANPSPSPSTSPSPSPSTRPSPSPSPSTTPSPSPSPSSSPTPSPSPSPSTNPSPGIPPGAGTTPSPSPSSSPTPDASPSPSPDASPEPDVSPSPTPSPSLPPESDAQPLPEAQTIPETTEEEPVEVLIDDVPASEVKREEHRVESGVYSLRSNDPASRAMNELRRANAPAQPAVAAAEDVSQVKVRESERDDTKMLILTGVACLALCLLGAGTELGLFRLRLKRRLPFE